jgi:hypothetical protein
MAATGSPAGGPASSCVVRRLATMDEQALLFDLGGARPAIAHRRRDRLNRRQRSRDSGGPITDRTPALARPRQRGFAGSQALGTWQRDFGGGSPMRPDDIRRVIDDDPILKRRPQLNRAAGGSEAAEQRLRAAPVQDGERNEHAVIELGGRASRRSRTVVG